MRKLIERAFCNGITVGISLYQRMIVSAHERKKPLKIGNDLYYLENGREKVKFMQKKEDNRSFSLWGRLHMWRNNVGSI